MFLNPKYRQTGLFAFPYQVFFEFLAPLVEVVGYLSLPFLYFFGSNFFVYFGWFVTVTVLYSSLISLLSVVLGMWLEQESSWSGTRGSLLMNENIFNILKVIMFAVGSTLFYRQYIILWQVRGFIGFLKKKEAWEKLERRGLA